MFRTEVYVEPSTLKIGLDEPIFCIGSCFADVIGQRLVDHKFKASVNPFGTIYNPASIFRLLHDSINLHLPAEDSYLCRDDLYYNFQLHSEFVADDKKQLKETIRQAISLAHLQLKEAKWIIITLGTANCYERTDNRQIVANCHKMPASYFQKRLLMPEEIIPRFEQVYYALKAFNSEAKIILTLSPVRHVRDTLVSNSTSKASLRLSIEKIISTYPNDTQYFPSYEIMMDDLRDYRFYEPDMVHPNEVAQNFIWDKWIEAYLDEGSVEFIFKWDKVQRALMHKPFKPSSKQHQKFVKKTIEQLEQLNKVVDVNKELAGMKRQLL